MRLLIPALIFATGCVQISPYPDVGVCAEYPDGQYEFGQIGIGTCLAGPNELQFLGEGEDTRLLVTNANPYLTFTGGSLLSIPWSNIDVGDSTNELHTLDAVAMPLPNFGIGLTVHDGTGYIGLRESSDARTRVYDDEVLLVDLSDPADPTLSTRGTDGGSTVEVKSDPIDVEIDAVTGLAFVANRTDHDISVLDTTQAEIATINPWPLTTVSAAVYADHSETGGQAHLTRVDILGDRLLLDDVWTLTWAEGTWRLWTPSAAGLSRSTSQLNRDDEGALQFYDNAMGVELAVEDLEDEVVEVADPSYSPLTSRMVFASEGTIWGAASGEYLGDWIGDSIPTLEPEVRDWMGWLGGPNVTLGLNGYQIFFDAQDDDIGGSGPSVIGTGASEDGLTFQVASEPALRPSHDFEGEHISDPHVIYDPETQLWRMMYSAFDGTSWRIGHAYSEDLESWTSDSTPLYEAVGGAAAPSVHAAPGRWLMAYSEWSGSEWTIAMAESRDGTRWARLPGEQLFGDGVTTDDFLSPPSVAFQGSSTDAFQVRGEHAGPLGAPLTPGLAFAAVSAGWSVEVVAGAWLDLGDAGSVSSGGVQVDSLGVVDDTETAWITLTSRSGRQTIGVATLTSDGQMQALRGAVFEGGGESFEAAGVSHPVVFEVPGGYHMLYAGQGNNRSTIGLATSSDGLSWTSEGRALTSGSTDWDRLSVVPNSVVSLPTGGWRMWYSGFDGSRWRIGSATSDDGVEWTRDDAPRGYQLGLGRPGSWDDSGVKDAWVLADEEGEHLWYSGFDGNNWRIGYAFRAVDESAFSRPLVAGTDDARVVLDSSGGPFYRSDVTRPVVVEADDGFEMHFGGWLQDNVRVGRAFGFAPDRFNTTPNNPRVGDTLTFSTELGDEDGDAIPLDGATDGSQTTGIGLTSLHLDEARGFLYAVSKLYPGLFVIDVRDDTDAASGFFDKNYLGVEAVLLLNTTSWATGFRQVISIPGSDHIYGLVDSPASVVTLDMSTVVDDEYGDYIHDPATGFLAAPRGAERDQGATSMSSVGPGRMLLHPDGRRLFVSNFNRNSITTYDLSMGPYGMIVGETPNVGENPYSMVLSPDGQTLVFGNYTGEVVENVTHASIGLLDVNEASPTYLEVLTWLANL